MAFGRHAISIDEKRKKFPVSLWDESGLPEHQSIEQLWFAGVHSDVGGWYDERGLSDIALIWMVEQAESAGLKLKEGWKDNLKPNPEGELHNSRQGFWRLWCPAPRPIPANAKIHDSVRQRKAKKPDYNPPNLRADLL